MAAVAIGMVKEMPGPEVTKALAAELPNLSATSQVQLISALGDRGDKVALPAVAEAVKSKDQAVRIAAIKAISQLGDESNVILLAKTAAGSSGQEQKAAQESLARLRGDKVDETILEEIPKAEPKTKVELISSVGKRNIYPGVKTLLTSAMDGDRKVRSESRVTVSSPLQFGIAVLIPAPKPLLISLMPFSSPSTSQHLAPCSSSSINSGGRW